MAAEERELEKSGGKSAFENELLPMLKKGETVVEALQRLGNQAKKHRKPVKSQVSGHDIAGDQAAKLPTDIEKITDLASNIMSLGEADIYSKTYEELVRSVRSSGRVDPSWEPPSADIRYEYKWDVHNTGQVGHTFGPFSEEDMKAWMKASYFGVAGEKVKIRRLGGEWGDWDDVIE